MTGKKPYEIFLINCKDDCALTLLNNITALGHRVTQFTDYREVNTSLEKTSPDLIISYFEPETNCTCEADNISESINNPNIPILVVTSPSLENPEQLFTEIENGMEHFILLPCEKEHLEERICEIVKSENQTKNKNDIVNLEFDRQASKHKFNLRKEQLAHTIISSVENAIHQGDILKKVNKQLQSTQEQYTECLSYIDVRKKTEEEKQLEKDLRVAVEHDNFTLHYQPIISLETGYISGFEALVRLYHPDGTIIPPDNFIPLAEETGLIVPIGSWVIREACAQIKELQEQFPSTPELSMSINLSTVQFKEKDLTNNIEKVISEHGLDPSTIRFEITESSIMENLRAANMLLLELKSNNHQIYMDDFGTGYSSLSYLKYFPVDVLKIDKSFVKWMGMDEQSDAIVRTIVSLAKNLKLSTIAEGMETDGHLQHMRDLNCEYGQGYFFSKPLVVEEISKLLSTNPCW